MNSSAQVDPSPRTRAPPGRGSPPAAPRRRPHRLRPTIQLLLFLAFTACAALPILALALWNQNVADHRALAAARERHLLVAESLSISLSRYVQDTQAAFALAFESGGMRTRVPGLRHMLASLDLDPPCVIGPRDTEQACLGGVPPAQPPIVPASRIPALRALAAAAHGQPAISPLTRDRWGDPAFYLVMQRPHGRLGVGILSTAYIRHLRRQTAADATGLIAVTDATGKVIAHPLAAWEQEERDLSGLSDVREMLHGKTGTVRFVSPMTRGVMIGGDSVVPETGWGVVVAQPIADIRAPLAGEPALVVALAGLAAAALLSQWLAAALARPIRQAAATAEAVRNGSDTARVPPPAGLAPRETMQLRTALNAMLDDLARRIAGIAQARHRAETASIGKSQFLASISQEIRTPLHGVVGMIALLQQTGLTPVQAHYAGGARQSGETLVALLDDILDLSRIEAGRLDLEPAPFHPPTLVHDVVAAFAGQARAKGLSLSAAVQDGLDLTLCGDAHRLGRVLTSLVANALKFTAEGGVTIGLTTPDPSGDPLTLVFAVTDTGIGIPDTRRADIFEAYAPTDSTATRRHGGTGLGLSIARRLCHLVDGDIAVESTPGAGSTFRFHVCLPRSPHPGAPATAEPAAATPPPSAAATGPQPGASGAAPATSAAPAPGGPAPGGAGPGGAGPGGAEPGGAAHGQCGGVGGARMSAAADTR